MTQVLARKDRALSPEETEALLRSRLGDAIGDAGVEFGSFVVWVSQGGWHAAVQLCRDEPLLAYDMFDCLFGVDARDEGFDVVAVLYSTSTGNRISLRTRCDGGRDEPVCPTVTDIYRGADWMERETWDMFGIEFDGHPGLEPRLLTVENFEGWPLRKDFHLTSRIAKPWPGVKEPAELDEDGNVIERVPEVGDAPGPYELDKVMAEQAKAVNAASIEASVQEAEAAVEATEAAEHDAAVVEADATDAPGTGEGASDHRDAGPSAAEKAEARRKEQAQARREKAQERAEQAQDDADEKEGDA